jgi:hypothetical protein
MSIASLIGHAELVSASTVPLAIAVWNDAWMLKRVQHDFLVFCELGEQQGK